ncbi:hypothetical protein [Deinococcus humi]|uniref:Uncharacterized protein n=1 Tax=Deinococcus humi TaxID=662880 RepID=A0A7W8JYV1_9DEIO|nr:hypothetical protein [Deinococcus humi]MBB5365767.1 hypothetical protein [Deinococcus humi]GGO41987.1 hypothetical protein GCM10008949_53530 [Deinococcus humi]
MSIDPKRIKNSRTAARAVLNIMAHYGINLTNYKPVTCAQFLLLGLDIFMEDLPDQPSSDTRVLDVIARLHSRPGQKRVAELFQHSLRKADLKTINLATDTITMGDLEVLSTQGDRKAYRYTKIVGSQDFKAELDQKLFIELHSIFDIVGAGPSGFSVALYHLVKQDLYRHFYENYPINIEDCPELTSYQAASLYFATKSFLMARDDVFDSNSQLLDAGAAPAVQRFLQKQGVYRVSDWFPQSAQFIAQRLLRYIIDQGGTTNGVSDSLQMMDPFEAYRQHRHWYYRFRSLVDSSLRVPYAPGGRNFPPGLPEPDGS